MYSSKEASIIDITNSAVAYIKMKILVTANAEEFDAYTLRELIKELKRLLVLLIPIHLLICIII